MSSPKLKTRRVVSIIKQAQLAGRDEVDDIITLCYGDIEQHTVWSPSIFGIFDTVQCESSHIN
jgi:hypothetical protein